MRAGTVLLAALLLSFGGSGFAQTSPQLAGPYTLTNQELCQYVFATSSRNYLIDTSGGSAQAIYSINPSDTGTMSNSLVTITFDPNAGTYSSDGYNVSGPIAIYSNYSSPSMSQSHYTQTGTFSITATTLTVNGKVYQAAITSRDIVTGVVGKMSYQGIVAPDHTGAGYCSHFGTLERVGNTQLPPAAALPPG